MQIDGIDIEEFIEDAKYGLATKERVLEVLDSVSCVLDTLNADSADIECLIHEAYMELETNKISADQLRDFAVKKGVDSEDIDEFEKNMKERNEAARLLLELEALRDTFKNFNKQNCFANIRALLKEKTDIKIGMIEKEAGIRLGYMARLEKTDNTSEPSMEFIASAAKLLGVTIDMLITGKIDGLNENERFVLKFLDTLIADTMSGDMTWAKETPKELENVPYVDGKPQHPLMKYAESYEIGESGYPEIHVERTEFNSLFFNDDGEIKLLGNVYNVELPRTDTRVYIAHIEHDNSLPFPDEQYEVHILQQGEITGLCGTCHSATEIKEQIIRLYKTIEEMNSGLGLNDTVKSTLDFYMTNSSPSLERKKLNNISQDIDDELPFI